MKLWVLVRDLQLVLPNPNEVSVRLIYEHKVVVTAYLGPSDNPTKRVWDEKFGFSIQNDEPGNGIIVEVHEVPTCLGKAILQLDETDQSGLWDLDIFDPRKSEKLGTMRLKLTLEAFENNSTLVPKRMPLKPVSVKCDPPCSPKTESKKDNADNIHIQVEVLQATQLEAEQSCYVQLTCKDTDTKYKTCVKGFADRNHTTIEWNVVLDVYVQPGAASGKECELQIEVIQGNGTCVGSVSVSISELLTGYGEHAKTVQLSTMFWHKKLPAGKIYLKLIHRGASPPESLDSPLLEVANGNGIHGNGVGSSRGPVFLHVKVLDAQGLEANSACYVVIACGDATYKTEPGPLNQRKHIQWNEVLNLEGSPKGDEEMIVEVRQDLDNTVVGSGRINLDLLLCQLAPKTQDVDLDLTTTFWHKVLPAGTLRLSVTKAPKALKPQAPGPQLATNLSPLPSGKPSPISKPSAPIPPSSATGSPSGFLPISPKDKLPTATSPKTTQLNQTSQQSFVMKVLKGRGLERDVPCYVLVSLGDVEFKTQPVEVDQSSVEWAEELVLTLDAEMSGSTHTELSVDVIQDKDKTSIGVGTITLENKHRLGIHKFTVPLTFTFWGKTSPAGELDVSISFMDEPLDATTGKPERRSLNSNSKQKQAILPRPASLPVMTPSGAFSVRVMNAKELEADGACYVAISFGDKTYKTSPSALNEKQIAWDTTLVIEHLPESGASVTIEVIRGEDNVVVGSGSIGVDTLIPALASPLRKSHDIIVELTTTFWHKVVPAGILLLSVSKGKGSKFQVSDSPGSSPLRADSPKPEEMAPTTLPKQQKFLPITRPVNPNGTPKLQTTLIIKVIKGKLLEARVPCSVFVLVSHGYSNHKTKPLPLTKEQPECVEWNEELRVSLAREDEELSLEVIQDKDEHCIGEGTIILHQKHTSGITDLTVPLTLRFWGKANPAGHLTLSISFLKSESQAASSGHTPEVPLSIPSFPKSASPTSPLTRQYPQRRSSMSDLSSGLTTNSDDTGLLFEAQSSRSKGFTLESKGSPAKLVQHVNTDDAKEMDIGVETKVDAKAGVDAEFDPPKADKIFIKVLEGRDLSSKGLLYAAISSAGKEYTSPHSESHEWNQEFIVDFPLDDNLEFEVFEVATGCSIGNGDINLKKIQSPLTFDAQQITVELVSYFWHKSSPAGELEVSICLHKDEPKQTPETEITDQGEDFESVSEGSKSSEASRCGGRRLFVPVGMDSRHSVSLPVVSNGQVVVNSKVRLDLACGSTDFARPDSSDFYKAVPAITESPQNPQNKKVLPSIIITGPTEGPAHAESMPDISSMLQMTFIHLKGLPTTWPTWLYIRILYGDTSQLTSAKFFQRPGGQVLIIDETISLLYQTPLRNLRMQVVDLREERILLTGSIDFSRIDTPIHGDKAYETHIFLLDNTVLTQPITKPMIKVAIQLTQCLGNQPAVLLPSSTYGCSTVMTRLDLKNKEQKIAELQCNILELHAQMASQQDRMTKMSMDSKLKDERINNLQLTIQSSGNVETVILIQILQGEFKVQEDTAIQLAVIMGSKMQKTTVRKNGCWRETIIFPLDQPASEDIVFDPLTVEAYEGERLLGTGTISLTETGLKFGLSPTTHVVTLTDTFWHKTEESGTVTLKVSAKKKYNPFESMICQSYTRLNVMIVTVHEAIEMKGIDSLQVQIGYDEQVLRTSCVENTYHPTWEEAIVILVDPNRPIDQLTVQVFDMGESLGQGVVNLLDSLETGSEANRKEFLVPLYEGFWYSKEEAGSVRLSIEVQQPEAHKNQKLKSLLADRENEIEELRKQLNDAQMQITAPPKENEDGEETMSFGTDQAVSISMHGFSAMLPKAGDYYLRMIFGDEINKTAITKNTKSPVWDETFVFHFDLEDVEDSVEITVFHQDLVGESVGCVRVSFCDIDFEDDRAEIEVDLAYEQRPAGTFRMIVVLDLLVPPEPSPKAIKASKDATEKEEDKSKKNESLDSLASIQSGGNLVSRKSPSPSSDISVTVMFTVCSARLKKAADYYVKVNFCGRAAKTMVKSNTKDPVWNETLTFTVNQNEIEDEVEWVVFQMEVNMGHSVGSEFSSLYDLDFVDGKADAVIKLTSDSETTTGELVTEVRFYEESAFQSKSLTPVDESLKDLKQQLVAPAEVEKVLAHESHVYEVPPGVSSSLNSETESKTESVEEQPPLPVAGGEEPAAGGEKPAAGSKVPASGGEESASEGEQPASGGDETASGGEESASGGEQPVSGGSEAKTPLKSEVKPEPEVPVVQTLSRCKEPALVVTEASESESKAQADDSGPEIPQAEMRGLCDALQPSDESTTGTTSRQHNDEITNGGTSRPVPALAPEPAPAPDYSKLLDIHNKLQESGRKQRELRDVLLQEYQQTVIQCRMKDDMIAYLRSQLELAREKDKR